ncbi:unnamed protein product [Acanthoscelides obtectus]|uniref:Uncharacterized protein n=1 Tax=Acanthoscelides obtectus TaxID=200917 RepID=A0A9P0LX78_ACAOB|nr:unnamed protein product [Acanthoscelides obtectus]CAK1630316.1 hypothetical protein AOBTE_LOCUS6256 [Acanthoscelides obtectus]
MVLKKTTRRSRSSWQLLTADQARDRHSRKLNIQNWKKLCTCGFFRKEIGMHQFQDSMLAMKAKFVIRK